MLVLTSCKKGGHSAPQTDTSNKYSILKDYMVANNFDLEKILGGTGMPSPSFVVSAPTSQTGVDAFLATYYIMDIRLPADYNAGKLTGAINVEFKNILTAGATATKPILVVCYSGNESAYATALLRMYGKRDAVALRWGMSGWNSTYANHPNGWNNRTANIIDFDKNHFWSVPNSPAPATEIFLPPNVVLPATAGEAIFKARIEAVVAEGFKGVSASTVRNSPRDYFINAYLSNTDYLAFGHILIAQRIQPFNLAGTLTGNLTNLNIHSSFRVAVYCHTGQTSGVVTAWLRVLGYDSYSLTYGMNALWHTNPAWGTSVNKWTTAHPIGLN